jgi:hypothetical protein
MNVKIQIGTEAAQFPEKEYINGIFVEVYPFNITDLQKIVNLITQSL